MAWSAKATGSYSANSDEGLGNVREMFNILTAQGWSTMSIAAMLGNGAGESGLNPWRWESDDILATTDTSLIANSNSHGYGIFQFTPAGKYIYSTTAQGYSTYAPNFSDQTGNASDGDAQTRFMAQLIPNDWSSGNYSYYADDFSAIGVDINDFYYMSFDEFKAGTGYTLDQLVGAYELKFERPQDIYAASSYSHRCSEAANWLNVIQYWSGLNLPFIFIKRKRHM